MGSIHNDKEFYRYLHQLEDQDDLWYEHVGMESKPNVYVDDGDVNVPVKVVFNERQLLKKLRKTLNPNPQIYRKKAKRDAIRLHTTFYSLFGLTNKEISILLQIPESTVRHDYRPLKPGEVLEGDFEVELHDKFGKHLRPEDL